MTDFIANPYLKAIVFIFTAPIVENMYENLNRSNSSSNLYDNVDSLEERISFSEEYSADEYYPMPKIVSLQSNSQKSSHLSDVKSGGAPRMEDNQDVQSNLNHDGEEEETETQETKNLIEKCGDKTIIFTSPSIKEGLNVAPGRYCRFLFRSAKRHAI